MISKTSGYAIRGIIYIALKSGEGRKIGIHELAEELNVPQPFLGKILQGLVRRDIVSSTKGPNGGFFLNANTLKTTALEIIDAIDGLGQFRRCLLGLPECSGENPCPLHHHVVNFRDNLVGTLETLTVQELMTEVAEGHAVLNRLFHSS